MQNNNLVQNYKSPIFGNKNIFKDFLIYQNTQGIIIPNWFLNRLSTINNFSNASNETPSDIDEQEIEINFSEYKKEDFDSMFKDKKKFFLLLGLAIIFILLSSLCLTLYSLTNENKPISSTLLALTSVFLTLEFASFGSAVYCYSKLKVHDFKEIISFYAAKDDISGILFAVNNLYETLSQHYNTNRQTMYKIFNEIANNINDKTIKKQFSFCVELYDILIKRTEVLNQENNLQLNYNINEGDEHEEPQDNQIINQIFLEELQNQAPDSNIQKETYILTEESEMCQFQTQQNDNKLILPPQPIIITPGIIVIKERISLEGSNLENSNRNPQIFHQNRSVNYNNTSYQNNLLKKDNSKLNKTF